MQYKDLSKEELGIWGERVSKAVQSALVVHMTHSAKL